MNRVASLNDTELATHDLRELTNQMVDRMLKLIEGCSDSNVTREPEDLEAHDPAAATEAELKMPWTLGHVIVHTTASAEEAAALAAELARGVEHNGRSRREVHWRTVTTIQQCHDPLKRADA